MGFDIDGGVGRSHEGTHEAGSSSRHGAIPVAGKVPFPVAGMEAEVAADVVDIGRREEGVEPPEVVDATRGDGARGGGRWLGNQSDPIGRENGSGKLGSSCE